MDVSVCIVSFNTRDLLYNCLTSLRQATSQISYEVIVTDNGSTDGTIEMLQTEFPEVKLIRLHINRGYTLPMNLALRSGTGDYLMQLNPDTVIHQDLLENLLAFIDVYPEAGICTPKVLNQDGTLQKQCRRSAARPLDVVSYFTGLAAVFPKSEVFGRYLMTFLPENEICEVEAVSGSCMLIRREVVDQIGYLDEAFFAYQEDSDYCFRAREAGWEIYYVPTATLVHLGGRGGSMHNYERGIKEWHRSYELYYDKHLAKDYSPFVNKLMHWGMKMKYSLSLAVNALRRDKVVGTPKP